MAKYLFLFTVGPVQSFIFQARKTRDLYAGSFILSYLCEQAIDFLKQECGNRASIVFPHEKLKSKPNRFLAVLNEYQQSDLQALGEKVEQAVRNKLNQMAESILQNLRLNTPGDFESQISSLLQVYWVISPYDRDFASCYRQAESSLGSIKNIRVFEQREERPGIKCSVTGEHNVLIYRGAEKWRMSDNAVRVNNDFPQTYLAEKEGLGAPAFIKRCADKFFSGPEFNFPSTGRIALLDAAHRVGGVEISDTEAQYIFDYKATKKMPTNLPASEMDKLQNKQEQLQKAGFSTYYAVLIFDADDMGKWLSGEKLTDQNRLEEFHLFLSKELGTYAETAKSILKNPRGIPVYAGGDDFLGFVNLSHLFDVIKELRESFANISAGITKEGFSREKFSFSAGIAIAHHKEPLSAVIEWAKKMEKEAKSRGGKDAFGIVVLKRSGEIVKTVHHWRDYQGKWISGTLHSVLKSLTEKHFSDTYIRVINREFYRLVDEEDNRELEPIIKSEIRRLLRRACILPKPQDMSKEQYVAEKEKLVQELAADIDRLYLNSDGLGDFLSALNMMAFLDREVKS